MGFLFFALRPAPRALLLSAMSYKKSGLDKAETSA